MKETRSNLLIRTIVIQLLVAKVSNFKNKKLLQSFLLITAVMTLSCRSNNVIEVDQTFLVKNRNGCEVLWQNSISQYIENCAYTEKTVQSTRVRTKFRVLIGANYRLDSHFLLFNRSADHNLTYTLVETQNQKVISANKLKSETYMRDQLIEIPDHSIDSFIVVEGEVFDTTFSFQPIVFKDRAAFNKHNSIGNSILGVYFGFVVLAFFAAVASTLMGSSNGISKSYVYLIFSYHILAVASLWGLVQLYLDFDNDFDYFINSAIICNSAIAIRLFFLRVFFSTKHIIIDICLFASVVFCCFIFTFQSDIILLGLVNLASIVVICLYKAVRYRSTPAIFMTAAYLPMLLLNVPPVLFYLGIIKLSYNPLFLLNVSLLGEVFVTGLFTLNQIRLSKVEKSIKDDELKALSRELSKFIGNHHHIYEQIVAGACLEDTMPVASKEGIVLCWDIVDSTDILKRSGQEVFDEVMKEISDLCMSDYNAANLSATGYVINEMGDGGLISVGFPYKVANDIDPLLKALNLSEKIIRTVESVFGSYGEKNILVCIGIAKSILDGKFTNSSLKRYQISGSALTAATRYENLRKIIHRKNNPLKSNLIIMQEDVVKWCPLLDESQFVHWDPQLNGIIPNNGTRSRGAFLKYVSIVDSELQQQIVHKADSL